MVSQAKSSSRHRTRRTLLLLALALLLALLILAATLLVPRTAGSAQDLAAVPFGWPTHFVVQNQSGLTPPAFPYRTRLLSPQEHPTRVDWIALAINAIFVLGFVLMIVAASLRPRRLPPSR